MLTMLLGMLFRRYVLVSSYGNIFDRVFVDLRVFVDFLVLRLGGRLRRRLSG